MALTPSNIETILNTLVFDGKAESSVVMGGEGEGGRGEGVTTVYRLTRPLLSDTGISRIPCGVCPVSIGGGREGQIIALYYCDDVVHNIYIMSILISKTVALHVI